MKKRILEAFETVGLFFQTRLTDFRRRQSYSRAYERFLQQGGRALPQFPAQSKDS